MPSSEPQAEATPAPLTTAETGPRPKGIAASLVILLVGALTIVAVGRSTPGAGDLPLLPPLDGNSRVGAESLTIAATPPPTSLGPGVVGPADEGPAYRLGDGAAAGVVSSLTTALGFTASPESGSDERGYLVVDAGSDRVLRVENSAGYRWSVHRGDPDCFDHPDSSVSSDGTISCPESDGSSSPGQVQGSPPSEGLGSSSSAPGSSGEQVRCPPVDCPEGQACAQVCPEPEPFATPAQREPFLELPSPEAAETRAREVMQSLGLQIARSTLAVAPDGRSWQVLAELAVNGIPAVGMDTQLSIGQDATVVAGSGMIPDVELLGDYPLITADEALVRLQQIHSPNDQPHFDGREPAMGAPEPMIEYSPSGGLDQVTAIRLVLLLQGTPGGASYLVPAFQMDASDGSAFTVPAAMEEYLTPT